MLYGIIAGITWALETVILGYALSMTPFVSTEQAIVLAPFVSTFIHDFFSSIWALIYNCVRGKLKYVWRAFKTRGGRKRQAAVQRQPYQRKTKSYRRGAKPQRQPFSHGDSRQQHERSNSRCRARIGSKRYRQKCRACPGDCAGMKRTVHNRCDLGYGL